MDPTAALLKALNAMANLGGKRDEDQLADDREEAVEGLRALADWLEKGGFAPKLKTVWEKAGIAEACYYVGWSDEQASKLAIVIREVRQDGK